MQRITFDCPEALIARLRKNFPEGMDESAVLCQALEHYLAVEDTSKELEDFLRPRLESARKGQLSERPFSDIINEIRNQP